MIHRQPLLSAGHACSPQNCKQRDPKWAGIHLCVLTSGDSGLSPMPSPMPSCQGIGIRMATPLQNTLHQHYLKTS